MIKPLLAWWKSDNSTALGLLAFIVAIPLYFVPGLTEHVAVVLQLLGALHITPPSGGSSTPPTQLTGLLNAPPGSNPPPAQATATAGLVVTPPSIGGASSVAFQVASTPVVTHTTIAQAR